MPRYFAHYQNSGTGQRRMEIRDAENFWQAITELPTSLNFGGKRYARKGVPQLYDNGDIG